MSKKSEVIELFKLAGYDFVEERPKGRLLFYEIEQDNNCQFWYMHSGEIQPAQQRAMKLIINRATLPAIIAIQTQFQNEFKRLLGL